MNEQYRPLEKDILANIADLSLKHGPVELQITTEDADGDFIPEFTIRTAPDGVLRGLMEDDNIASMDMEFGELHIIPAPDFAGEASGYRARPFADLLGGLANMAAAVNEAARNVSQAKQAREDGKVTLAEIERGGCFILGGHKFVKLNGDAEAALALKVDPLPDTCAFKEEQGEMARNNYFFSDLRKQIEDWIDSDEDIREAALERELDLTSMDGMKTYGDAPVRGRSLSIDEYRQNREFIPLTDRPYWLATPWCTAGSPDPDTSYAYCVNTSGALNYRIVCNANICCPRPALYLQSEIFVSPAE